jgi:hypothetical protein
MGESQDKACKLSLELHMQSDRADIDRPAVPVVTGIVIVLIVKRKCNMLVQLKRVELQQLSASVGIENATTGNFPDFLSGDRLLSCHQTDMTPSFC